MSVQHAKNISMHRTKYFLWMFLFILLELLPTSLQSSARRKRQIVFPGNNYNREFPPCTTPDRRAGTCVPITSCSELRRINNYNRLRRFFCGFVGDEPRVCCPGLTPATARPTPIITRSTTTRSTTTRTTSRTTSRTTTRRPNVVPSSGGRPSFLPQDCGKSRFPMTKVVGGKEAEKGSWPWMVVIYKSTGGTKVPDCGGTLVTNQHVITAAHCVVQPYSNNPIPTRRFSVRLGEHDLYSENDGMNPVDVDVSLITRHENFVPTTFENDIAVMKLVRSVQFNENISAICLPYGPYKDEDLTGRKSFIAGWGATAYRGPSSDVLRQASFEIQPEDICQKAFDDEGLTIKRVYICAGKLDGTKDSCQGDSGGPLMSIGPEKRFHLVGIVSFGKYCATPGYPGVYTRVTEFLNWLSPLLSS